MMNNLSNITKSRMLNRNLMFKEGPILQSIKGTLFKRNLDSPVRDYQLRVVLGNLLVNILSNSKTVTPLKYFNRDLEVDWDAPNPTSKETYNTHEGIFRNLLVTLGKHPQYFSFIKPDDSKRSKEMLESRKRMATTVELNVQFLMDFIPSVGGIVTVPLVMGLVTYGGVNKNKNTHVDESVYKAILDSEVKLNDYFARYEYAIDGEVVPASVFIDFKEDVTDKWIGGRVYGHPFTNAPKTERHRFSIDGTKDLTKLDFKSFSARCLNYIYGFTNTPEDFYRIPLVESGVIDRDTAKQCFMFLFGRGPYSETTGKIKSRFKAGLLPKGTSHQKVINELLKLNPALLKIPTSDPTLGQRKCETIESKILRRVIDTCADNDLAIAPIHDGVFCKTSDAERIKQIMESSARKVMENYVPFTVNFIVEASLP
jgi:hypothetical protein